MEIQINKISKKLKDLREQHNFTQEELAKSLGVSRQSIISLEQGRCLPSLPLAISFSEVFQLPFEEIFIQEINNFHREVRNMAQDLSPIQSSSELTSLHEEIDRFFEENFHEHKTQVWPQISVQEKNNEIVIKADLPGLDEKDISVEVGEETVTISGTRKSEEGSEDSGYFRTEISYGEFSRTITLPKIDKDSVEAELKNGILTLKMLKMGKIEPKVTKIKINKG